MTTKELGDVFNDMQILKHVLQKYAHGLEDQGKEAKWALIACKASFYQLASDGHGMVGVSTERIDRARMRYRDVMMGDVPYGSPRSPVVKTTPDPDDVTYD